MAILQPIVQLLSHRSGETGAAQAARISSGAADEECRINVLPMHDARLGSRGAVFYALVIFVPYVSRTLPRCEIVGARQVADTSIADRRSTDAHGCSYDVYDCQ